MITTTTDSRLETIAQAMLDEVREMQTQPLLPWKGKYFLLPDVRSFSELHDYFDANVWWEAESFEDDYWFTDEGHDLYRAIQDRVDELLRDNVRPSIVIKAVTKLAAGDVILDAQAARNVVIRVVPEHKPADEFEEAYDGFRIYTDRMPETGQVVVPDGAPDELLFRVLLTTTTN